MPASRRTSRQRLAAFATASACSSPRRKAASSTAASVTCRGSSLQAIFLVVNTSATLPAAVPATRADGAELEPGSPLPAPAATRPLLDRGATPRRPPFGAVEVGEDLVLPAAARARILAPYAAPRLWLAHLDLPAARDLPRRARATDSVRLRAAALAALRLPNVYAEPRRRDAERGETLHARADHARRGRCARRADHAAHRRLLAGAPRASPTRNDSASRGTRRAW